MRTMNEYVHDNFQALREVLNSIRPGQYPQHRGVSQMNFTFTIELKGGRLEVAHCYRRTIYVADEKKDLPVTDADRRVQDKKFTKIGKGTAEQIEFRDKVRSGATCTYLAGRRMCL